MTRSENRRGEIDPPERDLIDRLERERESPKRPRDEISDIFQVLVGGPAGLISGYAAALGRRR